METIKRDVFNFSFTLCDQMLNQLKRKAIQKFDVIRPHHLYEQLVMRALVLLLMSQYSNSHDTILI
jgi:hypothetical protein